MIYQIRKVILTRCRRNRPDLHCEPLLSESDIRKVRLERTATTVLLDTLQANDACHTRPY